ILRPLRPYLMHLLLYDPRCIFLSSHNHPHRHLHPFPTRRSSDLYSTSTSTATPVGGWARVIRPDGQRSSLGASRTSRTPARASADRKSTRLNSSHGSISYAVFCLKKKKCAKLSKAR